MKCLTPIHCPGPPRNWTSVFLDSTFNYAKMAALIAPRPFMVQRGHFDGVAPDETVGYESAKVFNLYDARLHKRLKWPVRD